MGSIKCQHNQAYATGQEKYFAKLRSFTALRFVQDDKQSESQTFEVEANEFAINFESLD